MSGKPQSRGTVVTAVRRHHALVRWAHWLNIPILLGLSVSGMSIYWASPVYQHTPDPQTQNFDWLADAGIWLCAHLSPLRTYADPQDWIYNHFSLGPGQLAAALRWHWLFIYLFLVNGLCYVLGLGLGGGYRSLLPRRSDHGQARQMIRYYLGAPIAKVLRREWPHPPLPVKYNALQRGAYLSVGLAGVLSVLTGWAIHQPAQLFWLTHLFGGYAAARAWHFWLMIFFLAFTIPHVSLVIADGWDTLRSMITGLSLRPREHCR